MSLDASIARQRTDFVRNTSVNVGAVASASAAYVTAEEIGQAPFHQTVLSFAGLPVFYSNAGSGAGFGSKEIYTFPKGRINILGVTNYFNRITFNTEEGEDGAIGGGGSGDYSFGQSATSDATLNSTDVDMLPSTAMLDPFVGGVGRSNAGAALAAAAQFNGTLTATPLYLNSIIDDADVGDLSVTAAVAYFTGWARITWAWLGDF